MTVRRRCFFVLAQGRSGTAFLADLLNRDGNAQVRHEPWPGDPAVLGLSRSGRFEKVVSSLLEGRFGVLLEECDAPIYGEVNSYLRYVAPWLRSRLDATLLHVVRDGRDFVRSAWIRDVQRPGHAQLPMVPTDDDPAAERWHEMDRFRRICWIWAHTNERLARDVERWVRLEDLLRDFEVLREAILKPTGVTVSEGDWRECVHRPRNTSASFSWRRGIRGLLGGGGPSAPRPEPLGSWRSWDRERTRAFWEICGPTMERFGYRPDGD